MNKKYYELCLLTLISMAISGCGNSNQSSISENKSNSETTSVSEKTSSEEISSETSVDYSEVTNEDFNWSLKQDQAIKGLKELNISSNTEYVEDFKLTIDDEEVKPANYINAGAKITYKIDPDYPCHSTGVEHCRDDITINGKAYGVLPADDSLGVSIPVEDLVDGFNVFSVTIGQTYANKPYNKSEVHGGLNNASGDDFGIGEIYLETASGIKIAPTKMSFYKPVSYNSIKYNVHENIEWGDINNAFYTSNGVNYIRIGDGWGSTSSTMSWDGNTSYDSRWDIPFQVDFYFEYYTPESLATYSIDTSKYKDGKHSIALYANGEKILQNGVYFDNGCPSIVANLKERDYVNQNYKIKFDINDECSGIVESKVMVDGLVLEDNEYLVSSLNLGVHSFNAYAKDKAGNETLMTRTFTINFNSDVYDITVDENKKVNVTLPFDSKTVTTKVYQANKLNVDSTLNDNTLDNGNLYDYFSVKVTDTSSPLFVTYNGSTFKNERIAIDALNVNTNKYERITETLSDNKVSFKIDPKDYTINEAMKFKVYPIYFSNGSDNMLWASDTQYLPKLKFTDINYMYTDLMNYFVEQYESNSTSFILHTGDVVDNNPEYGDEADAEWKLATKAFEILDENDIPYGVSAGNHDVGTATISYKYFSKYFGVDRFKKTDYFGGVLNDNEVYYDLVTIGNYDFVIVGIGFGIENDPDTLKFVDEVLNAYPNRNAIIATHAYLTSDGSLDTNVNAQAIYDKIVVPHENVKFVFCGHTDGNAYNKKVIGDREVIEILNCSQFVQTKSYSVSHVISGYNCNGEGFIKRVTFNDDSITIKSFSPVINDNVGPFKNGKDNFTMSIDLIESERKLTTNSFEVYQCVGDELASYDSLEFTINQNNCIIYTADSLTGYGFVYIGG